MATTSSKFKTFSALKRLFHSKQNGPNRIAHFERVQEEEKAFTSIDRGTSLVPIERIVGSVGRYHDFDVHFKPRGFDSDERLVGITKAMRRGKTFPPISLYQIKDNYYILDGHHRYTAAKNLGHDHINACIVELMPSKDTLENRLYIERTEFRDRYDLAKPIELTELGQFKHLALQIEDHRTFLEHELKQEVPPTQAAADWYKTIYQPLRKLIENSRLADSFEQRTIDDLYLYISYHQWQLGKSRQYGIGIDKLIPKNMEEFRKKMAQHSEREYPEMRREINAFILMNVEGRHEEKIMDKLFELEAVREIHSVHGAIDIIIRVQLTRDLLSSDAELLSQFLQTTIRQWNGIISTQTLLPGVSRVKDR